MKIISQHILFYLLLISVLLSCKSEEVTPPYAEITGIVSDIHHKALGNVSVSIAGKQDVLQTTDNGFYRFTVDAPGSGTILFIKEGFISGYITYDCLPGETVLLDTVILEQESKEPGEPEEPGEPDPEPYLIVHSADTIRQMLYAGSFSFSVQTSAETCTATCEADWLTIYSSNWGYEFNFWIEYKANPEEELRRAQIILQTETGLKDTIWLEQYPGPVLTALEYSGQNKAPTPFNEMAFIKFSRKVKITYISSTKISNLIYEEDSTRVRIPDIDVIPHRNINYSYTAISNDGQRLEGEITVVPPYFCTGYPSQIILTNANQYCWTLTHDYPNTVLSKYKVSDSSQVYSIKFSEYRNMCYNPYNNCIYVYGDDIQIIDVDKETVIQRISIPIEANPRPVKSMDFGYDGLGLFQTDKKIYTIDATANHKIEPYSCDIRLYNNPGDPIINSSTIDYDGSFLRFTTIKAFNNRQQFLLYSEIDCRDVIMVNVTSKEAEILHTRSDEEYTNYKTTRFYTHKKEPFVTITDGERTKLINSTTKNVQFYPFNTHLVGPLENETPWNKYLAIEYYQIYTIDRWSQQKINISTNTYYNILISEDGEYVLLTNDYSYLMKTQDLLQK